MSELPISSKYRSRPNEPVSEEEREQLSRRLNSAFADGALDAEQYEARLDRLFAAGTLGELVPVVDGLPPAATYEQPAMVVQGGGRPGEVTPANSANRAAAITVGVVAAAVLLIAILLVVLL